MSTPLSKIIARRQAALNPQQLDLFSAATTPPPGHPGAPKSSHGGYPSTTAGSNGTSSAPGVGHVTIPITAGGATTANSYSYNPPGPNWGTVTIGIDGSFVVSTSTPETDTIPEYSFTFTENGVARKAVLAPEYDMTPLEGLKLTRLLYSAPNHLNKLEYVKNNGLLRHFRLE